LKLSFANQSYMAAKKHASSSSSLSSPLHKGRACINCRRRKIKCDGTKPVCGPCTRSSETFRDCEYSDSGFTRTQLLEEQIAMLEARLEQLECPESESLTLHNPYGNFQASSSSLPQSDTPEESLSPSTSSNPTVSTPEELPPILHQALLHTFLHHCSEFGFFLDVTRFTNAAMGITDQRLSPALLNTAYLWGAHLSRSMEISGSEIAFASRALQSTAQALSGDHSQGVVQCIQAEVLLALYFFRNARVLEGKYHTSAAVSLVLSAGLHKLRTTESHSSGLLFGPAGPILGPPADAIEEGERINAFWTVLILNNCWTTADASPSNISYGAPGSRVDTPWPREITAYSQSSLSNTGSHTIQKFLANNWDDGTSTLALHAKASILFEQSARFVRQYHQDMSPQENGQFYAAFTSLDNLLIKFTDELPSIQSLGAQGGLTRTLMIIHTLVHVAAIQLHNPFIVEYPASQARFVASASSIVQLINDSDIGQFPSINPIIGPLWAATCRALIVEVSRYRTSHLTEFSFQEIQDESNLVASIETVMHAMSIFASSCHLMESQLSQVRNLYTSIRTA